MTSVLAHDVRVEPLTAAIGAEIHDIDLGHASDEDVAAVWRALNEHHVVFFRDQHISRAEQVAFARRFGNVTPAHPVFPGLDDYPEIHRPGHYQPVPGAVRWGDWHSDLTCFERPPAAALLRITELPGLGGDTTWASTQAAYDRLSPPLQRAVSGLVAVHNGDRQFGPYLREHGDGYWEGEPVTRLETEHPVVRVHPENGRKGLFVNPGFTKRILGLDQHESDALLALLYEHMTRPEHAVRWRWAAGDLAFWDNRATLHYAIADYGTQARVVERVTISGDRPMGPNGPFDLNGKEQVHGS